MSKINFVFAQIAVVDGEDTRDVMTRRGSKEQWYETTISSWRRLWRTLTPMRVARLHSQTSRFNSVMEVKLK